MTELPRRIKPEELSSVEKHDIKVNGIIFSVSIFALAIASCIGSRSSQVNTIAHCLRAIDFIFLSDGVLLSYMILKYFPNNPKFKELLSHIQNTPPKVKNVIENTEDSA